MRILTKEQLKQQILNKIEQINHTINSKAAFQASGLSVKTLRLRRTHLYKLLNRI